MTTITTVDLKSIHKIYQQVKKRAFRIWRTIFIFLATCLYLDVDIDFDTALKFKPYGGLIGIDNSPLDKYFKSCKILILHAILHNTSGFVFENNEKGPGCSYVLHRPVTNEYPGDATGLVFSLHVKTLKNNLIALLEFIGNCVRLFKILKVFEVKNLDLS